MSIFKSDRIVKSQNLTNYMLFVDYLKKGDISSFGLIYKLPRLCRCLGDSTTKNKLDWKYLI